MRIPPIDKNPGDFVSQGSRTAIRRFNRKIPRHSENHKLKGDVLLQFTGRRGVDCNTLGPVGLRVLCLASLQFTGRRGVDCNGGGVVM